MSNRHRFRGPGSLAVILLFLGAALAGTTACGKTAAPSATKLADVAPQLIGNERDSWKKYVARDLDGSRGLLAADYADVQGDGTVLDREGHLAFVPKADVEWHELDRFNVFLLSEDSAVVTYRARSRDHGTKHVYQADVTAGWSRRDGKWVATFYRESPTPPEASGAGE